MSILPISAGKAKLNLALLSSMASKYCDADLYLELQSLGLPSDIFLMCKNLLSKTVHYGLKTLQIGKIVVLQILEFVRKNPFLTVGLTISSIIGISVYTIVTQIPFLGTLLAPLAKIVGIAIVFTGATIGHRLDKKYNDVGQDVYEIAEEFFAFFSQTLKALRTQIEFA